VLQQHLKPNAAVPLMQKVRSTWPDVSHHSAVSSLEEDNAPQLPPRTVPDDKLSFRMRVSYTHGTDIYFPHMKIHPADYKVALFVRRLAAPDRHSALHAHLFVVGAGS
jgi:hypothetical protein